MSKITYGLSNLYYAPITVGENNAVTYGTPVKWQGAKEISLEPTGEPTKIYADDITYVTIDAGGGYEGDLTMLTLPDAFCTDILGMTLDANGVLVENTDDVQVPFALLGEFKTESATKKRFVIYNCTAGKPNFGSATKEETVEPTEFVVPLTASGALDSGAVKATVTNDETTVAQFNNWFAQVYTGESV